MNWSAGIDLDEGRLGKVAVFGLKSREEAIAWQQKSTTHLRWWWCKPSAWIRDQSNTITLEQSK